MLPEHGKILSRPSRSLRKILVVDDEAIIRDMMADILDIEGYIVDLARNGREALEKLRGEQEYLVFLDLMMPVLDGRQVCLQLLAEPELRRRHAIVVMSALDQLSDAALLSVDAMMPKPFVVDDVMRIVDKYMSPLP